MSRVLTWKGLVIAVGLLLVVALICVLSGNTGMATVLIIGAVVEGGFHAILVGFASAKRRRHESQAA